MTETGTGKFKILSAAWLGMGGLFLTYALPNLFSLAQGNAPSAGAVSEGYWFYLVGALVMGAIGMANGLALLRRSPVTRPLLAVSSLVLLSRPSSLWFLCCLWCPAYGSRCQVKASWRLRYIGED